MNKKAFLKLHKKAYRAYKRYGQTEKAEQARKLMLKTYLDIRAERVQK